MLQIYDGKSTMLMPNGETMTAKQLKADGNYSMLFNGPCVVDIVGGVFCSMQPLEQAKAAYGITTEDPEAALQEIIAYQAKEAELAATNLNDTAKLAALAEANAAAIEELIPLVLGE